MDGAVSEILRGNVWLAVCCGIYLAWWCIAFNPLRDFPMPLKVLGFVATLACGILAVVLLAGGMGALPAERIALPGWAVWLIGAGAYGLLLFVTSHFFGRQVTTELLLIVAWATFELSCVNALAGVGAMGVAGVVVAIVATVATIGISMACYLAYYDLAPVPAFVSGMVPLVLIAATGLIVDACVALS